VASDLAVAQKVLHWLEDVAPRDPEAITAAVAGRLHEEAAWVWPDAKRRFGMATLRAATRPAPKGCCRWGQADLHAKVHGLRRPGLDAATKALVGGPCARCVQRVRAELTARVDSGRRSSPSRIVSPAVGTGARAGPLMSSARRGALLAAAGLPAGVCCETWRATNGRLHFIGCRARTGAR
jgi:hypothetical protein